MEWTPESGEQERHNVTVITVGSKYEVYVRSPASSHMQTLEQPFLEACNKVRGKYIWKEVFLRLYPASFLPVSSSYVYLSACVCRLSCVCYHCVGMYPVYICMQHLYVCLYNVCMQCVCVYLYVCMNECVCLYVCMCKMYVCNVYVYVCLYEFTYIMCICNVCVCVYLYVCMNVCVWLYVCARIMCVCNACVLVCVCLYI